MTSGLHNSEYHTTWSFAPQGDSTEGPHSTLHVQVAEYNEMNANYLHAIPFEALNHPLPQSPWQASPSASPTCSDYTTSSTNEDPLYYPASPLDAQYGLPSPVERPSRANYYPPSRLHTRQTHPLVPEPETPVIHETYEVETGEDEVVRAIIHRLTDEEKRNLNAPSATRPNFCCRFQGCGRWLLHRAQVKPHLSEHGYRFRKPFRCACGAEFGRQVEAARHVEDKKLCEQCHRSGRKYKGSTMCIRCLRQLAGK